MVSHSPVARVSRLPDSEGLLPPLLPALALLAFPVFLIFGPVWVAPSGAAHYGDKYRDRDDNDNDETDAGGYGDTQGKTSS